VVAGKKNIQGNALENVLNRFE